MSIQVDSGASLRGKGSLPSTFVLCSMLPFLLLATAVGAEDWSYEGRQGPSQWKGVCNKGHQQSPVNVTDIRHFDQSHLAEALLHVEPTRFHADNTHNFVDLKADEGSALIYEGRTFELSQVHWHTPSEHRVRGKAFDMEMHWVFLPNKAKREVPGGEERYTAVVIAVFMQVKADSEGISAFDTVLKNISLTDKETHIESLRIDLTKFLPSRTLTGDPYLIPNKKRTLEKEYWQLGYYTYDGSLTTPPCTEKVRWLLLPHLVPITQEGYDSYVQYGGAHSARPVQPLYER
ncbi:MAG: carbonic anhydrase family protein [Nitrospiraceae bacterium]